MPGTEEGKLSDCGFVALDATPEEAAVFLAALAAIEAETPDAKVLLFGSRARRDCRPDSDYDLLVLFQNPIGDAVSAAERVEKAANDVEGADGAALNIQFVPAEKLEDLHFEWPFLPSAMSEGVDLGRVVRTRAAVEEMLGRSLSNEARPDPKGP